MEEQKQYVNPVNFDEISDQFGIKNAYGIHVMMSEFDADFCKQAVEAGAENIWRVYVTNADGGFVMGVRDDGTIVTRSG